ncbi:sensor histidine kinase [Sabulibacter ruber]|uniref:sensor histidine kinase n=1 Tax=Sabulibacter ruber TaxID=2811901 RepID=UPI001A957F3B|nr:GAF domain-containing sensor histidine kinase [Sabulibacter ruber]
MEELPHPAAEALRIDCLDSYQIMDSPSEEAFDSLVQLTASVFKVPFAALSFLHTERLWIKASFGLEIEEMERNTSFCHQTIQGDEVCVFPDTHLSPLFSQHPAVAGENGIRFYAGAPLITKTGFRLGTLCIMDTQPRSLSPEEKEMLRTLANQVMPRLDLQLREQELEKKTLSAMAFSKKLDSYRAELDQIAYAVSHELKSPLRAINNLAEWVSEELEDSSSKETKKKLSLMRGRVHRLENLFNGLLELSNISKIKPKLEQVDTYQMVTKLIAYLQQSHSFSYKLAENLPTVEAERKPLETVFWHLLKNAAQHNPTPGLHIEIGTILHTSDQLVFYVKDNGKGIAASHHSRIFELFKTVPGPDKQVHTGIGLSLVSKIVQEREAKVWVESKEPGGSTFYFTWPAGKNTV